MQVHTTQTDVSQQLFREALGRLGAAVNIITTDGAFGRHGLTASAVCSVSDAPPTVLACVNRNAGAHEHLLRNGVMCINMLGGRHQSLSDRFGRRGVEVCDRFAAAQWKTISTGSPVLVDATASLDCVITDVKTVGTHSVIFGEVRHVELSSTTESLIYFNRNYHRLASTAA